MAPRVLSLLLATGLAAGCAPARPAQLAVAPDDRLAELLAAAFDADTRLETPDSLYAPDATVVADGYLRFAPPRFAAVEPGGAVAVTSTRIEVRAGVAFAYVEYRYVSPDGGSVRAGRATVVLSSDGGAWRIRHAHSSAPGGG